MKLHSSLTRQKEMLAPLHQGKVGLYVCGPTVYSRAHIGNARPVVIFDVLYRYLKELYEVTYVRNITDVDDKIIEAAKSRGIGIEEVTQETTAFYHQDMGALYALSPTLEPRATQHIPHMIRMIETLIQKGTAYEAEGHVLFEVGKDPDYGSLAGRKLEDMIAGTRVEVAPYKKNPMDFVLWKPSTLEQPGWESPWGRGRPGWHIECSAMAKQHLGDTFDIHGGGCDLMFPHHENECAQSRCANGVPLARIWMHNGALTLNGEKMSKSLGNILTVRDMLLQVPGSTIRYALLSGHYRQSLDWTNKLLTQSQRALEKLRSSVLNYEGVSFDFKKVAPKVRSALEDDLNTPLALSYFHELHKEGKTETLYHSGRLLGFFEDLAPPAPLTDTQESLLKTRVEARLRKDFAESDRLRQALLDQGIVVEDTPQGARWRRI